MLNNIKYCTVVSNRGFKNFGHKRQPPSLFTTLWHGFLTFSFIGMAIEWKRFTKFLIGEDPKNENSPFD